MIQIQNYSYIYLLLNKIIVISLEMMGYKYKESF
jgi:hypothetical protein